MGANLPETLGRRARDAHQRQIELATRVAGSGNVDSTDVRDARIEAVAAMGKLISIVYKGVEPITGD